jgi:uncharacterized lipoprotein YddW (UPF0748 family)
VKETNLKKCASLIMIFLIVTGIVTGTFLFIQRAQVQIVNAQPSTESAFFGKKTIGSKSHGFGPNQIQGSRFTLNEDGIVTNVNFRVGAYAYGSGRSRIAIYSTDAGHRPASLLGLTSELVNALSPNSWISFPCHITLAAGEYWLLLYSEQNPEILYDNTGIEKKFLLINVGTFSGFPSTWTFVPYYLDWEISIYAEYTRIVNPLSVDVNPTSASLQVGQSQTFTATVSGGIPPYTVIWVDNDTEQVIGSGLSYCFNAVSEGNKQIYAKTTDSQGTTASSVIIPITVSPPPPLRASISPSSPQFVQVGGTLAFNLTINGGVPPYIQQWYINSTPVAEATGMTFNFSKTVEGTFVVFVLVTDKTGAIVTSNITTVTVAAPPPKFKSEFRALFIHAMSLNNPDWQKIAETAQNYGMNGLVVEILTSTGARYPSKYVPAFTRDELTSAIAAAHSRGLSLYISYDVLMGALTDEYKAQDHTGALLNWTCPVKAISRTLIRNLVEEVSSYDIDGIMLDYIRYDSGDMCYCPECKAAFESYLGETITNWPGDFAPGGARYDEFMEWRTYPVDYLVRDIRKWALAVNPHLEVSAAVWGWPPEVPTYNRYWIGQDSTFWVKEGWLDWIAPMIYTTNVSRVDASMKSYQKYMVAGPEGKIPLVPLLTNAWPIPVDPNNFKQQIDTVRANNGDGWIIWRYGGPGDGQGSDAPDIRTYLDLIDLYPTFSLRNINISAAEDRHVITWKTELPATSAVEYSTSPLFNATLRVLLLTGHNYWEPEYVPGTIIEDSTPRTEHSIEIPISEGTPFYVRIKSSDDRATATSQVYGIATTGQGVLTVETTPVAGNIYVDGQLMGNGYWSDFLYVGTHLVSYGPVAGYVAPCTRFVDVFDNQTTTVTGTYAIIPTGILTVDTTPIAGQIYVNGTYVADEHYSSTVRAGVYVISFGDIKGYTTPQPQTVIVIEDAETTVFGVYVKIPTLTYDLLMTVTRNGAPVAGATVSVESGPSNPSSQTTDLNGVAHFTDLLAGSYTFLAKITGYYGWVTADPSVVSSTQIALIPEPTLGKTTVGATGIGFGPYIIQGSRFTLPEDGVVNRINIRIGSYVYGSGRSKIAIYSSDAQNRPLHLMGVTTELVNALKPNSWVSFPCNITLAAGEYWLLLYTEQNPELFHDSTGIASKYLLAYIGTYGDFPNPWVAPSSPCYYYLDWALSIYAEYIPNYT